jgi:hypothetical protein
VPNDVSEATNWEVVSGRALAVLCLHAEGHRGEPLVDQWLFLDRLGMPRDDAAALLSTTSESLRVSVQKRKAAAKKAN